jgi:O-antigen ligase
MKLKTLVVPKRYPLRFWLLVVFCSDVPNFVQFDSSGRTHEVSLFNPTSLTAILITLMGGGLLITLSLLNRQKLLQRPVKFDAWVWLLLLANYIISSILTPPAKLTPAKPTDLPVTMYRLLEWIVLFALLLSVYTREPEENAVDLITRIMGYIAWGQLTIVWVLFVFMPHRVYAVSDDAGSGHARFGGGVTNAVYFAEMAGIAFFYSLFFWRGKQRYFCCALAFLTLMLTYARSEQLFFMIALFVYLMIYAKRPIWRWAGALSILATVLMAAVFFQAITTYLERGQGVRNILTLSERTDVWKASLKAYADRPWLGYGYIVGVKKAIKDHWNATNWVPPYAHNEFIQALVSGGPLAALLDLYIYFRMIWLGLRQARKDTEHTFFVIVLIQLVGMSFLTSTTSVAKGEVGAMFVLLFFGIVTRPGVRKVELRPISLRTFEANRPEKAVPALSRWRSHAPSPEI